MWRSKFTNQSCGIIILLNFYIINSTMISLEREIDLSKEKAQQPELQTFMRTAIKQIEKEDSETIAKFKKPLFDEDLQNHLIVTNIPDVTGKQQKFLLLFLSFLDKKNIGKQKGLQSCQIGCKEEGDKRICNQTIYLIYKSASNAKRAYQKLHMLKFNKQHTLSCFTVKQFRLVQNLPEIYRQPKNFSKKQMGEYNLDQFSRDQFIYRLSGSDSERLYLKWFDHVQKSTPDALKGDTDIDIKQKVKNITFSPLGTYASVCVSDGVRVFAGPNLQQKAFFPHRGACQVAFSPNEKYMVTFTGADNESKAYQSLMLWSVEEQVKLYSIRAGSFFDLSSIQFNHDCTKLAIVGENEVYIHDCSTFSILKQSLKSSEEDLITANRLLKAPNIKIVTWIPDKVNLLCICYEINPAANSNSTSKIYFHNIQTGEERKWRAIGQHIKKVEVTISDHNEWIAVSFKKIQKKTQSNTAIYIVNLTKREVETDVLEFKESVVSISWDKKSAKFGVVYALNTGVKSAHTQFGVYFYQLQKKNHVQQSVRLCQIASTPLNRIIMAPNGLYFALYNITPQSSGRDKYSFGYLTKDPKNKKITIAEMVKEDNQVSYMSFFSMDVSGRFVMLGTDKMFQIWSMAGELLEKNNETLDIKNVQFRPRYLNDVSPAEEKFIAEKEKQLKKKYGEIDEQRTNALEYKRKLQKLKKRQLFKQFIDAKRQWYNNYKTKLVQVRGFDQQDNKVKSGEYIYLQIDRN